MGGVTAQLLDVGPGHSQTEDSSVWTWLGHWGLSEGSWCLVLGRFPQMATSGHSPAHTRICWWFNIPLALL